MSQQPTNTEVRESLARILSSPSFARAHRAQAFLRFIVDETLAGRARTVNSYAVAIEVFHKPAAFDAANDPTVRVEAGRVRSRLTEYYATVGANDAVRVELKRGSYVPAFSYAPTRRGAIHRLPARAALLFWLPAAAGMVAVVWALASLNPLAWRSWGDEGTEPAAAAPQTSLRILVEPFDGGGDAEMQPLAVGITEEVMVRLGAYQDLQIFVSPNERHAGNASARSRPHTDYVLAGSVRDSGETLRVLPRLVDARSGQQVWSAEYEEPLEADNVWNIVDAVSIAVARAVGEPYGPLFGVEVSRAVRSDDAADADAYHCLLRFVFALQVISEGAHGRATSCFEHVVAVEPNSSMSWARLAALYRMEYLHDFNPKADSAAPLDRAAEAVRQALNLDSDNVFAQQEMAFLCLLRNDDVGFEKAIARTLALKPSADIRAALGINFVKMGQPERGFPLIEQGLAESPRAPPFFFLGYVVNELRMHDYAAAYVWAERMATRDWPLSQAVLAAVAALAGDSERASAATERLLELRPNFPENGRALIARGHLGQEVEDLLARGLALAGVQLR